MTHLDQIQEGIDYIESRLDEDIDVALVARSAGISRWHFQRMFKALTNETVKTYIRSRRLARSLDKLLTTDERVIEVALAAGYESQASFTRAFKDAFGLTPAAYRKLGDRSLFLKKAEIDIDYLQHINQNLTLTPTIVHRPAMTVAGLRTVFYGPDSEKNNVAGLLAPLWANFLECIDSIEQRFDGDCYGVINQISEGDDLLEYYACIEIDAAASDSLPEGMEVMEVPPATYATFSHRGDQTMLDSTVNYIYSNWLLQSPHQHTYGPDLEVYGVDYIPGSIESLIHYAVPIRLGSESAD